MEEKQVLKVVLTGSGGMVGGALAARLEAGECSVHRLVHGGKAVMPGSSGWDYRERILSMESCEGCDAVVHLAGENIAQGRWTAEKKKRIRESRVIGTRFLAEEIAKMRTPPKTFISASAIGFYGSCTDDELTEENSSGGGFLAEVCRDWEEAASPLKAAGIRVVHLRIGVVLSRHGGALAKMLLPFQLGVGGIIGSGRQYMSCIELGDLVSVIEFSLRHEDLAGPVNAVCPDPVTNSQFTRALGKALSRPTIFPMPAFAARLAFGEMADELLLSSARVLPAKLAYYGFAFASPTVESALQTALKQG